MKQGKQDNRPITEKIFTIIDGELRIVKPEFEQRFLADYGKTRIGGKIVDIHNTMIVPLEVKFGEPVVKTVSNPS